MNILHIIPCLPRAGAETLLLRLCIGLRARFEGYRFSVLTLLEKGALASQFEENEIPVKIIPRPNAGVVSRLYQVWRFIRRSEVDIIHTHLFYADKFGLLAGWFAGQPIRLCTLHNMEKGTAQDRKAIFIQKNLSTRIITVSRSVRNFWKETDGFLESKMTVIHNTGGFDAKKPKSPKDYSLLSNHLKILAIGRLNPQKGHLFLIRAFSLIFQRFPELSLDIYGDSDGNFADVLINEINECHMTGHILIHPTVADVEFILLQHDLLISPSLWEGIGMVNIEAMSTGLPVLASNIPPHKELFGEKNKDIFFEPGSASSLAAALERVLFKKKRLQELSEFNLGRSREFNFENFISNYDNLYRSIP